MHLPIIYTCFPQGKHKVLTMSYDDGNVEDRRLIDIFNEYGIKGSFHLNSAISSEKHIPACEYGNLYGGHEISCHTANHPTLERCPIEQVVRQIVEDRLTLEKEAGYPVRGLSYPNGSFSDKIVQMLPSVGIQYARTTVSTGKFDMPKDYLRWNPTCHHNEQLSKYAEKFADFHKTQYLCMMYVWGHSYEFTRDGNWKMMEEFCKYMGNREDIWYATNIQIVNYMEAASRLQFSAGGDLVYNPSWQTVWIEVDKKIVELKGGQTTSL